MKKRLWAFLLMMVMITALLSVPAFAENEHSYENSRTANWWAKPSYTINAGTYGTWKVTGGTVVGYNNTTSGDPVKAVQSGLTFVNDYSSANCNPDGIDGLFGEKTYWAIHHFQQYVSITADGYAGNETWWYLEYYCNEI